MLCACVCALATIQPGLGSKGILTVGLPKVDLPMNLVQAMLYLPRGFKYGEFTVSMHCVVAWVLVGSTISLLPRPPAYSRCAVQGDIIEGRFSRDMLQSLSAPQAPIYRTAMADRSNVNALMRMDSACKYICCTDRTATVQPPITCQNQFVKLCRRTLMALI